MKSITKGEDNAEYLVARIPLGIKFKDKDELIELDQKLGLLFNPESKLLEEVFLWIRP